MTKEHYLELIQKLDLLIDDEVHELEVLHTLGTKTTQENDGMPHAIGISDKVGNSAVKILMKQEEINHLIDVFVDLREEIRSQIKKLPVKEYRVVYDYYVKNIGLFDIADNMNMSVDWIKKLKNRGVSKIEVIESEAYTEACEILFSKNNSHL